MCTQNLPFESFLSVLSFIHMASVSTS
jgi:hypothetical protein